MLLQTPGEDPLMRLQLVLQRVGAKHYSFGGGSCQIKN